MQPSIRIPRIHVLASAVVVALAPGAAFGSGFALSQQSAKEQGSAYAGAAASARDGSAVWFNPAGMVHFDRPTATAGVHGIYPQNHFQNDGSTSPYLGGQEIPGRNSNDGAKSAIVPQLFYIHPVNDDLAYGIGINVPFGLGSEYEEDWVGRYHTVESDLQTININPSMAYRHSDRISLGIGFNVQYASATLRNKIDGGAICQQATADPTCSGQVSPSDPDDDSELELDGDSWAFGVNLGVLAQVTERTRVGLAYRSEMRHNLDGEASFERSDSVNNAVVNPATGLTLGGALDGQGQFTDQDASTQVILPETVMLSAVHETTSRLNLMGDISWTRWSRLDELVFTFEDGQPDAVEEFDWQDTYRYSVGLTYDLLPSLQLRTGLAYDEAPVRNEKKRSPRVPDNDRTWYTLGLGYQMNNGLELDAAFTYIAIDDPEIENTNSQGHTLIGEYDSEVSIFSVGGTWRF